MKTSMYNMKGIVIDDNEIYCIECLFFFLRTIDNRLNLFDFYGCFAFNSGGIIQRGISTILCKLAECRLL